MSRRVKGALAILALAALVGGWIALRGNGLAGGLDHDGPLDALVGNEAGFVCPERPVEWANDQLRNLGDASITVDRITPNGPPSESGFVISAPRTFAVVPPDPSIRANKHAEPPRRRAQGTVIPPHGLNGVSYSMRYTPGPLARRSVGRTTTTFTVRGVTVDYHVGARHFREATGMVVKARCRFGR